MRKKKRLQEGECEEGMREMKNKNTLTHTMREGRIWENYILADGRGNGLRLDDDDNENH